MSEMSDLLAGMRKVELDQIEHALDDIWREMNVNTVTGGGVGISRNAVMTLVVYTHNEDEASRALHVLDAMGATHPSRCILVTTLQAREGPPIEAYVGAQLRT